MSSVNLLPLLISVREKFVKILGLGVYMGMWGGEYRRGVGARVVTLGAIGIVVFH